MTLSYWWMHWFWITLRICFSGTEESTPSHSTLVPPPTTVVLLPTPPTDPSNSTQTSQNLTTDLLPPFDGNGTNIFNLTFSNETALNQSFLAGAIEEAEPVNSSNLSAAGITGITLGCVMIVGVACGISYFLYRNRGFNRPQVLNDRCSNPDSSGYIDDASVRDNSEEMYSLDNDSFLNSLEAMTIQNYWTDTVKHTKL